MLGALDPGIRGSSISLWSQDGLIVTARYVRNAAMSGNSVVEISTMVRQLEAEIVGVTGTRAIDLVVEWPKVYASWKGGRDPADLFPLAGISAGLVCSLRAQGLLLDAHQFIPREWKNTLEKIAMTKRVRERLSAREFQFVQLPENSCRACRTHKDAGDCEHPKSCLANNVWDAVGIGLKQLGRLERRRVIT